MSGLPISVRTSAIFFRGFRATIFAIKPGATIGRLIAHEVDVGRLSPPLGSLSRPFEIDGNCSSLLTRNLSCKKAFDHLRGLNRMLQ